MPRKSAAALAVVVPVDGVSCLPQRPQPPAHLSAAAAIVWRSVTASRPAEYFDAGAVPLLAAFCVATAELHRVTEALALASPVDELERYAKLVRASDALAGRAGMLATKLRLTPQSKIDARAAGRASGINDSDDAHRERVLANYGRRP